MSLEAGLTINLRLTAPSVVVAQREIRRFILDHAGEAWTLESIARETSLVSNTTPPVAPSHV
jgi:hypothetical protein